MAQSHRSLHSAGFAVVMTGVLSISIPLALLSGAHGLGTAAGAQERAATITTVSACDGHAITAELALAPGDCVLVAAAGFTRSEHVLVRELNRPGWSGTAVADAAGRLRYRLALAERLKSGQDELTFIGTGVADGATAVSTTQRAAYYRFTVVTG